MTTLLGKRWKNIGTRQLRDILNTADIKNLPFGDKKDIIFSLVQVVEGKSFFVFDKYMSDNYISFKEYLLQHDVFDENKIDYRDWLDYRTDWLFGYFNLDDKALKDAIYDTLVYIVVSCWESKEELYNFHCDGLRELSVYPWFQFPKYRDKDSIYIRDKWDFDF
jgi:hypothetical protein